MGHLGPLAIVVMLVALLLLSICLRRRGARRRGSVLAMASTLADGLLLGSVLFFAVARPLLVETVAIPLESRSMQPTLHEQDRVLTNKLIYRFTEPTHGDIIVFRPPPALRETMPQRQRFIKRVVGVPGDRIRADRDGRLVRNGRVCDEPYITEAQFIRYLPFPGEGPMWHDMEVVDGEIVVPEGGLLVLGDNRNASHDSADWGYLPRDLVVGRAVAVIWPPSRARLLYGDETAAGW